MKKIILLFLVCTSIGYTVHLIEERQKKEIYQEPAVLIFEEIEEKVKELEKFMVEATYYNPTEEQCFGDPLITASGRKIDLEKLERGEIKWIAVSRDLLEVFKFGDTVQVRCSDDPGLNGNYIVADTMNKRFKMKIDFLWPESKKGRGRWQNVEITKLN